MIRAALKTQRNLGAMILFGFQKHLLLSWLALICLSINCFIFKTYKYYYHFLIIFIIHQDLLNIAYLIKKSFFVADLRCHLGPNQCHVAMQMKFTWWRVEGVTQVTNSVKSWQILVKKSSWLTSCPPPRPWRTTCLLYG